MGVRPSTKRLAAIALAASFLFTGSFATIPVAARTCFEGSLDRERILVHNFHIEAEPEREVYLVGETAVIKVKVRRPAEEDPAGQGVEYDPPQSEPAPDVNIGIGITSGDSFVFGFGVTDNDGKADVKVKLREGMEPGAATVDIYAWKRQVDTPCLTVDEYGFRSYEEMIRIVGA